MLNPSFADDVISMGPFRLRPSQRLLTKNGETVALGGRALDLLIALAERPGEVVSQKELIARAWPNLFVEGAGLRVHIAALRKALGCDGGRYLATVHGRGYSLVAPLSRSVSEDAPESPAPIERLAPPPAGMVGRDEDVRKIRQALLSQRFVAVVGGGGVGKTAVARCLAQGLLDEFLGAVCFVELGPVSSPELLGATVAAAFRLRVQTDDPIPDLIAHLHGKRALLVLDNCEHLIEAAAAESQRLFREAPGLHILATSREALRAEGENVHRLQPLSCPPDDGNLTAAEVLSYPAARLFVDRMTSAGAREALGDEEARIVGGMCRQLGGIALAIEVAAGRVAAFGIRNTASALNTRFALLWRGRRTALPRHQTLSAALDWSYDLLSEAEQLALRWLSVFSGAFGLHSARQIVRGRLQAAAFDEAFTGLLAKFLVSIDHTGPTVRYRLLATTRTYANGKLTDAGEWASARRAHAVLYDEALRAAAEPYAARDDAVSASDLDDIRSALTWAFDAGGDARVGIDIAAHSGPLWLNSGLLLECQAWMAKAAAACADGDLGEQQQRIQHSFAVAEQFTSGRTKETTAALARTLDRAESDGDRSTQFSSYLVLWSGQMRGHLAGEAVSTAEDCAALANATHDPGTIAMAEWMLGHSKHHAGRFKEARDHLLRYFELETETARQAQIKATGYDRRADAFTSLTHTLRALGQLDQARSRGQQAVATAQALGLAVPLLITKASVLTNTYLVEPDLDLVEQDAADLLERARAHSIASDSGYAQTIIGLCQARRGDFDAGARLVTEGLKTIKKAGLEALLRAHLCEVAIELGRLEEASEWAPASPSEDKMHWCSADILRVRGALAAAQGREGEAEDHLLKALQLADRQSALFWKLRATMSLSRLWARQHREKEALANLEAVYGAFSEGHGAADLLQAKQLIEDLGGPSNPSGA